MYVVHGMVLTVKIIAYPMSGTLFLHLQKRWFMSSRTTTELSEIRKWAEERGGKPARVIGTDERDEGGVLRIDFPGYTGKGRLEEISWEDWYQTFRDRELEFLYQDKTVDGKESRFFKLIHRDR